MGEQSRSQLLFQAADRAAAYLDTIADRRTGADEDAVRILAERLDTPLPEDPAQASEILDFAHRYGSPATVASTGGRYFGFVTGGALPASLAANWLAGAWDQNAFSHVSSPAAAHFEDTALRWSKEVLHLPTEVAGALTTGATMANFTCLAAARHRALANAGWNVERDGLFGAPPVNVVVGEEVHATVLKVLAMLGLGRERVIRVGVDVQGRMRADDLPDLDDRSIVCIQAGNVNSGAFDPAGKIIARARAAGAWVHVDGAFGLWGVASGRLRPLCADFTRADSWATDAHKWLNVPYDCGMAFVRDADAIRAAMAMSGAYLVNSEQRDAMDFTPDSSRRARGVDVWAALMSLGRSGVEALVERNCAQASRMAERLSEAGIEILNDVVLNQVVAAFGNDGRTAAVIEGVQADGTCWCGGTQWRGRKAMRISFSAWATTMDDVERSADAIIGVWQQTGHHVPEGTA